MTVEVPFNQFIASAPTVTILRVTPKRGFYEVEHYAPRAAQPELLPTVPDPVSYGTDELKSPPRFTFDMDPIGCEKRAGAWGSRGKK